MYIWNENGESLIPAGTIIPDTLWLLPGEPLQGMEELAELARRQHPEIRKLEGKIQQLEVEERLYRELLKPIVNVEYSYLNVPGNMFSEVSEKLTDNYKLGVDFSFLSRIISFSEKATLLL